MQPNTPDQTPHLTSSHWISWSLLLVLLSLTFVLWKSLLQSENELVNSRFQSQTKEITRRIGLEMEQYQELLEVARGLFHASKSVEHDEWKAYVESLDLKKHFPAAVGLGFIEWVPENKLSSYLKRRAEDGQKSLQIFPPGKREAYCPITYLEPENQNRSAIGYDVSTEILRRKTLDESKKYNRPTITPIIQLIQDPELEPSVLMLLPVQKGNTEDSFLGWIYAPIHLNQIIEADQILKNTHLALEVFEAKSEKPFYQRNPKDHSPSEKLLETSIPLEVAGKTWTLLYKMNPAFLKENPWNSYPSTIVLFSGILISFSIFGMTWFFRSAQQQSHIQTNRLRDLATLQESVLFHCANSVTITDPRKPNNPIIYVNPAFERMTGYSAAEVLGKNARFLTGPETSERSRNELRDAIEGGKEYRGIIRNHRKDGSCFENDLSISPIYDINGTLTHFVGLANDVTDQIRLKQELEKSEERFRYALDLTTDGLWDWNIQTGKAYYSSKWITSLGYSEQEVPPSIEFWKRIIHPDDLPQSQKLLEDHLAGRSDVYTCENRLRMKNGTYRDNLERGKIIERSKDGKPLRMVGSDTDIGARKRYEEELKHSSQKLSVALEAALQASRAKAQIMANVSHEIRTPLNGVIGMTEILQDTQLTAEQVEYLGTIRESGELLMTVVNDILDFSKLESGKLSFEKRDFNFMEILQPIVNGLLPEVQRKNLELNMDVSPSIPSTLQGDPLRLRQVLENIIRNAIKFTEKGSVTIRVTEQRKSKTFIFLKFEIKDTGVGISKETMAYLFEPFFQADSSYARKFGGTGLGLSICKQLIERMQGEIQVQSELNQGSCFLFTARFDLPKDQTLENSPNSSTTPNHTTKGRKAQVLVVEDNSINQRVTTQQLKRLGIQPDLAVSGSEALEHLSIKAYDLVLMDCQMPKMDGYATTQEIRKREGHEHHTVIVAVTAHASKDDRGKCLQAGMDDYLSKPFRSHDLKKILERWLPSEACENKTEENLSPWDFDLTTLRKITGNDQNLLRTTVQEFLGQTEQHLARAAQAVNTQNFLDAERETHQIAGAAGLCGAPNLSRLCQQLEKELKEKNPDIQRANEILHESLLELEKISDFLKDQLQTVS